MTAEKISKQVLVDNTAPVFKGLTVVQAGKDGATVKTTATDAVSHLESAAYSVDSGDWKMLDPVDGLLDQKSEDFAFDVKGLSAGEHVITVRVSDGAGNTAAAKGVVQIK